MIIGRTDYWDGGIIYRGHETEKRGNFVVGTLEELKKEQCISASIVANSKTHLS